MKKIQLKDLKLSIPEISIMESRQLMGGMAGYLAELVVIGNPNEPTDEDRDDHEPDNRPNQPEHDDRDNNIQNDDTQHGDNDQSSTDNNQSNINNSLCDLGSIKLQPQLGNVCVFSAISVIATYFGNSNSSEWIKYAENYMKLFSTDNNLINFINSFSGTDFNNIDSFIQQYFECDSFQGNNFLSQLSSEISEGNPVLGFIVNGQDSDGYDMHAIVIFGYDSESNTVSYWDPITGEAKYDASVNLADIGWGISGTK